jgi:ferredoxin-NADP reductase
MQKDPTAASALYQSLTITEIKEEANDVKTFIFGEADAKNIVYQPGQYLTFLFSAQHPEIRRSYSVTSTPVLNEPLSVGVKRIPNGLFSRLLIDKTRVGDKLLTIGAGGFFTFPENILAYGQLFFLAAGSGITPVFSLIKTALFSLPHLRLVLIYSNSSPEQTIFRKELQDLATRFPDRFRVEFLFSNSPNLARAHLYKDLLQQFVATHAVVPPEKMLAYVCGPESYMRMCTYGLELAGLSLAHIRKENFSTHKVATKAEPPDKARHAVEIRYRNNTFHFHTQFPTTILQAAKLQGIALPYSCEAGKCGNCVARCRSGKVWMSYNEVLTDKEVANGLVLTCTGYPIGGDVVLEI